IEQRVKKISLRKQKVNNKKNYKKLTMFIRPCQKIFSALQTKFTTLRTFFFTQHRKDSFTVSLLQTAVKHIAWTPFRTNEISQIIELLFDETKRDSKLPPCLNSDAWNTRKNAVAFLTIFVARSGNLLDAKSSDAIVEYILQRGFQDKQLEVRNEYKKLLSILIQSSHLREADHIQKLIQQCIKLADTKLPKPNTKDDSRDDVDLKIRKKHAGVLGLSAVVESFPYTVPEWIPNVVSHLCRLDREKDPIGPTAKKTIAEFKRTHNDEWNTFKKLFTEEQLQDLQDVGALHSYFS
ncbi:hypothetical protein RFI_32230, partial [Reticulomyxa filosa]